MHRWSVSQMRLTRCMKVRRAEAKYSSLRKLKPESVFLVSSSPHWHPSAKTIPTGNSWSCGRHSYTNLRSGKVASRSGPEEGHEGASRAGTADLRTHRQRERSSPASSCAPVRLEGFDSLREHGWVHSELRQLAQSLSTW